MLVGCQGMRALDALVKRGNLLVKNAESSIGPIYVQPESLLITQTGELIKRINRSCIDGSRACYYTEWPQSRCPIVNDLLAQPLDIHLVRVCRGDDTNSIAP